MITDFYFDGDIFYDESMSYQITNDHLLDMWINYGVLIIPEDVNPKNLIEGVDERYRQKWTLYLSKKLYRKMPVHMSEIKKSEDFDTLRNLMEKIDVKSYFFPEGVDFKLLPKGIRRVFCENFELLSPEAIGDSTFFEKSKKYSDMYIEKNQDFEDLWRTRFKSLVRDAKVITIIDKYLLDNFLTDYEAGRETSIERFLINACDNPSKTLSIHIYSSNDSKRDGHEYKLCESFITSTLPKKPYFNKDKVNISFNACESKVFTEESHDRLIRINDRVVEIGIGFEVFRDKPLKRTTCSIKDVSLTPFDKALGALNRARSWICK